MDIKSKVMNKLMDTKPSRVVSVVSYVFMGFAGITAASLFVLPLWLTVVTYLMTMTLGLAAFLLLINMAKASENPIAFAQDMLKDVDMTEVMALASAVFGQMPVKPTGPIGVVDDPSRK